MMMQEKGDRIHPLTLKTMSYQEFAQYRQKYLVTYYPFSTFGHKEEKQYSVRQKIQKWLKTIMKPNKQKKNGDNGTELDHSILMAILFQGCTSKVAGAAWFLKCLFHTYSLFLFFVIFHSIDCKITQIIGWIIFEIGNFF